MGFFDTIPANDPNNRAINPISAGQAKIRIGPISGTKVPYPLPRRFPHVVPNPISAFDGAVPDKNAFSNTNQDTSDLASKRFYERNITGNISIAANTYSHIQLSQQTPDVSIHLNGLIQINQKINIFTYSLALQPTTVTDNQFLALLNLIIALRYQSGANPASTDSILWSHSPPIFQPQMGYAIDAFLPKLRYDDFVIQGSFNNGLLNCYIDIIADFHNTDTVNAHTLTIEHSMIYLTEQL